MTENDASAENYTSSERKLKRITQQLPFNPPSAQQIQDRINQMRQKIAKQTEIDQKTINENQDNGSQLPRPRHRIYTETPLQYNAVTSLLTDRISKASLLNRTNDPKPVPRRPQPEYKQERISRDKGKNPLKYKIVKEEAGIRHDARVYDLRQDQVHRIQEQFMRRKGLEYLREGNNAAQRVDGRRFYSNVTKGRTPTLRHANSGSKIHQIFGNPISQSKRIKSEKSLKTKKGKQLEQLRQQEEMLGKVVFQKVKKHLKEQKEDTNYFRRVYTEETIDEALVDFLRVKIERAQASLGK